MHLALDQLELGDLALGLPLDQDRLSAAVTAASSFMTPVAKEATRLDRARSTQVPSSATARLRIMPRKPAMSSRASTSSGTPVSIAATVSVSDLDNASRPTLSRRATVRAEGARPKAPAGARSVRRRRVAHSVTTRKEPRKPCLRSCRHSSAPLCDPADQLLLQPGQVRLQRAFPRAEQVRSLATHHLADEAAAVAGAAHDLLDRHAVGLQAQDGGVGLLAAQIALVLDPRGGGQQRDIDGHCAHGAADLPHRGAHGIEEGTAGILHQVPAVGDLGGLGQRAGCGKGIATTTIAGHDGDLRLGREPGSRRHRLAVGQQGDGPAPFQITDDGPVALVATPSPVVDADDRRRSQPCHSESVWPRA